MNWWTDMRRIPALALAFGLCAGCGRPAPEAEDELPASGPALTNAAAGAATNAPMENVRVPLEHWPDGKIKTQIVAAEARMPEEGGDLQASRIRIETYFEDGRPENLVMAQDCRLGKDRQSAKSEGSVHMERDGVLITGKGFVWNGEEQSIRILRDVRVVLQRNIRWDAAVAGMRGRESEAAE
jgi:hypothetical protein